MLDDSSDQYWAAADFNIHRHHYEIDTTSLRMTASHFPIVTQ